MNCQQAIKHIWDLGDEKLSPSLSSAVENHCRECEQCQRHWHLTRLENEVLKDTTLLPALSPGFTARVMKGLPETDYRAGRQKRFNLGGWKTTWKTASSLVLGLLLLVLIWPGFTNNGFAPLNGNQTNSLLPNKAPASQEIRAGVQPFELSEEVKDNAASPSASITAPDKQNPASERPVVTPEPAPPPSALTSKTGENGSKISRGSGTATAKNEFIVEIKDFPYPVNLPTSYKLVNVSSNADNGFDFKYTASDANTVIELIINRAEKNHGGSGSEAESSSVKSAPANSLDHSANLEPGSHTASNSEVTWIISDNNVSYQVTLNGNLDQQELTRIAGLISFRIDD